MLTLEQRLPGGERRPDVGLLVAATEAERDAGATQLEHPLLQLVMARLDADAICTDFPDYIV